MANTVARLRPSVVGTHYIDFLRKAHRANRFTPIDFIGRRSKAVKETPRLYHWVTDQPQTLYPFNTVYHVTSNLAVEHMAQGLPMQPPKVLQAERIATHKGDILYVVDELLEGVLDIVTGEKESFLWFAPEADPQDYFLIQEASKLSAKDRKAQIQTLLELFQKLLAIPISNKGNITQSIQAIVQHLFIMSGIREGFYFAVGRKLEELIFQELGREKIKLFLFSLMQYAQREDTVSAFFPVVLEIDLATAYNQAAVNGLNVIPIRKGGGSNRVAGLPVLDPRAIRTVYSEQKLSGAVQAIFSNSPLESLSREQWLTGQTPAQITAVDPENPFCDTRYSTPLPVELLIQNEIICPLIEQLLNPSIGTERIPFLSHHIGLPFEADTKPDFERNMVKYCLDETMVPGLFDPFEY